MNGTTRGDRKREETGGERRQKETGSDRSREEKTGRERREEGRGRGQVVVCRRFEVQKRRGEGGGGKET